VRTAARAWPERIVVGIDARDGRVAVEGWAETSDMAAVDLARAFEDAGVAAIVYTDIERDGMLKCIHLEATVGLARVDDVRRLLAPEARVLEGAITGRALYDGRLDAREALALVAARG